MNQQSSGLIRAVGEYISLTRYLTFFFLYCMLISSCREPSSQHSGTAYNGKDLFSFKTQIKYAKGFEISYHANYKLVHIFNRSGDHVDTVTYILVQRGTPVPDGYHHAQKITIPLLSMIGTSSMHVALTDFNDCTGILTGLENLRYVSSAAVRERIAKGKIKEVGAGGSLNNELILTMHPDMVMVTENPETKFSQYQTLTDAGIPVLLNAEWMENTPLGQAEWVKLMAALVNGEELVNKKFALVENEYNRLAALGRKSAEKPVVITGMPYKGTWFVPKGDSFFAQFLADAGATYNWADTRGTGNLALSFEAVAPQALAADYWVNTGDAVSKQDITGRDKRYADFKPYKNGTVYNNNNKMTPEGSNDYWESGAVNPQLVLADLISIFHPGLLAGHQLFYYKQIR